MQLIGKYFPGLTGEQSSLFEQLLRIVPKLNEQVNIISRKDIAHLEERHILHSLAIARLFQFGNGCHTVDAGTGGGFPGIPLAILFPTANFILVDSIRKKIRMVEKITRELGLTNVTPVWQRVEDLEMQARFVVSRAVAPLSTLHLWTREILSPVSGLEDPPGGLIALKGGDLKAELEPFGNRVKCFPISDWFSEPFFLSKSVVYLKK